MQAATVHGHVEIVQALLAAGSDPHAEDAHGHSLETVRLLPRGVRGPGAALGLRAGRAQWAELMGRGEIAALVRAALQARGGAAA